MGVGNKLKEMVKNGNGFLTFILWCYNHLPFNNRFKIGRNKLVIKAAFLKQCKIEVVNGRNNKIFIDKGCRLTKCHIVIQGSNNIVTLSEFVTANNAEFYIEDNGNCIVCKRHINFAGKIHLACTEGKNITIGEDCLFSSNIVIRTGDSHSVVDNYGNRINFAKDVKIGNHVWVGHKVLINKGVEISDNSIIGTGAVVTKAFTQSNVCIAGNPAKIVKDNISWVNERI